jgi:hypothetical protein
MDSSATGLLGSGLESTSVGLVRQDSSSRTSILRFWGLDQSDMLPDKQLTTFNDGNEVSEVRSRHSVPVQNGPKHGTLTTTDVNQPLIKDHQVPHEDNANFHDIDNTVGMNGI